MKKQVSKKKSASEPLYRKRDLPVAKRVRDLMSRMTLEEKAAQMMCVWQEKAAKLVDVERQLRFGQGEARPSGTGAASARWAGRATRAGARTRAGWRS